MNEQILSSTTATERKSQPGGQSGYAAPRMFTVGSAVELIQGKVKNGFLDDDNTWTKEHK
jgi:hypothetical protein